MNNTIQLILAFIVVCTTGCSKSSKKSLSVLEDRVAAIDAELRELAHLSLRGGTGAIGYRSKAYADADQTVSVEVDLGEEIPIDKIVLVPTLWRSIDEGFLADGFPEAFRVLAGTSTDREGEVVAEFGSGDGLLPSIAPLVIPVAGTRASWVRIEAIRLSPRPYDGRYVFQLSELLVFSGRENRALRRPVKLFQEGSKDNAWDPRFLVDGLVPYLMNAAQGAQSRPMFSPVGIGDRPSLWIDLGRRQRVSGIALHTVDQSDTVPQSFAGDFGVPRRFVVEGADRLDFSDARHLLEVRLETIYDIGPILAWNFPEAACRYVRLTALEPYFYKRFDMQGTRIGFAEFEIFSKGQNVALGALSGGSFEYDSNNSFVALTDGRNVNGNILPAREWMEQLARRHDLEVERPVVAAEITRRYLRQTTTLKRMGWLAALLAAGMGAVVLYSRRQRIRNEARIRERIAANLHDELGANLHAIGLLGDLAKAALDSPEDLIDTVDRIRSLTERTGSAARNCANMIEAKGVCEDLVEEMRRDADRLVADLEHDISFEGEEILHQLKRRKRIDILLFYRECLINAIRHSGATRVETHLVASRKEVRLRVADNGHGYAGEVSASLKRRARLLGAVVDLEHPGTEGTRVVLTLKTAGWRWWKAG